jgi:hypothetical protein
MGRAASEMSSSLNPDILSADNEVRTHDLRSSREEEERFTGGAFSSAFTDSNWKARVRSEALKASLSRLLERDAEAPTLCCRNISEKSRATLISVVNIVLMTVVALSLERKRAVDCVHCPALFTYSKYS